MLVGSVPLSETIHGRATANGDDGIELARDPQPRQRGIGHQRQTLAGEVVADREDAKAPAVAQRIRGEVQAPTLIGSLRQRDRRPGAERACGQSAGGPAAVPADRGGEGFLWFMTNPSRASRMWRRR
jgi:hypothetical protein